MLVLKEHEFESFFMRLEKYKDHYEITFMPKTEDGSNAENEWHLGGGSVGMWETVFETEKQAEVAWDSLIEIGDDGTEGYSEEKYWQWIDAGNRDFPASPRFFT